MKKTKQYRSRVMASIHETAEGLNAAGLMNKLTMRKFDEMCLTPISRLKPKQIRDLRLDRDLSDYISAENFAPFQFEFRPKQKSVNLRISEELLNAVRAVAHRRGIPYQRYIRQTLEAALRPSKEPRSGKRRAHRSGK